MAPHMGAPRGIARIPRRPLTTPRALSHPASATGETSMSRLQATFARLRAENRRAFVTYVMAGDPDAETATRIVRGLPAAGVDVIELGLPFTDPMADGAAIQLAGQRALGRRA